MKLTIPGQTRAKKNSMLIIKFGKRYSLKSSKLYTAWEKQALKYLKLKKYPAWTGTYPVEIKFFFFRDTLRKWDIDNMFCGCLDVLQQVKIIEDDSMNHVIPIFTGWAIDKINPRVELLIQPAIKTYFKEI